MAYAACAGGGAGGLNSVRAVALVVGVAPAWVENAIFFWRFQATLTVDFATHLGMYTKEDNIIISICEGAGRGRASDKILERFSAEPCVCARVESN